MSRLSKTDWLDHGLKTLATEGFTGLKADRMAKTLGVSRGSFYWHFDDLAAFHKDVLHHYLDVTVLSVIAKLEDGENQTPEEKLTTLIRLAAADTRTTEQAVRAWAFSDPMVNTFVSDIDRQRLAYITKLVEQIGSPKKRAREKALLIYLSSVGYFAISDIIDADSEAALIEDLLVLVSKP